MQLANINNPTQTISTIALREMINEARILKGESKVQNTDFIARVEDELDDLDEGQKFSDLAPRTKTPMVAYTLTLEQATLVGMRESKAVRRNVLAKLKELQQPPQPTLSKDEAQARVLMIAAQGLRDLGVHPSIAYTHTLQAITRNTGVDTSDLASAVPALPKGEMLAALNPTAIGKALGGVSPRMVNNLLASAGLQEKDGRGDWVLTEAGLEYGQAKPYTRNGHSGTQVLWFETVLDVLSAE